MDQGCLYGTSVTAHSKAHFAGLRITPTPEIPQFTLFADGASACDFFQSEFIFFDSTCRLSMIFAILCLLAMARRAALPAVLMGPQRHQRQSFGHQAGAGGHLDQRGPGLRRLLLPRRRSSGCGWLARAWSQEKLVLGIPANLVAKAVAGPSFFPPASPEHEVWEQGELRCSPCVLLICDSALQTCARAVPRFSQPSSFSGNHRPNSP